MNDDEGLGEEIIKTLHVAARGRDGCLDTIRSRLRKAQSWLLFYSKLGTPGAQQKRAAALSGALRKAWALSQDFELFRAMMDDRALSFHDARQPTYNDYQHCLNLGAVVADELSAAIVVPRGQQPRDACKWWAKRIAIDLVTEFSPLAGKRGAINAVVEGTSINAVAPGERETIDAVASLLYAALTGSRDIDLSQPLRDYEPPMIKTRGRAEPEQKRPTTKK